MLRKGELTKHFDEYRDAYHISSVLQVTSVGKVELKATAKALFYALLEHQINIYSKVKIQLEPFSTLNYTSSTLIGTIYMHFVDEVLGKSLPVIKCLVCNRWFQSGHKGTMYCSDACEVKAYRKRKEVQGNKI